MVNIMEWAIPSATPYDTTGGVEIVIRIPTMIATLLRED
jgi:hypothetical protein